MKRVSPEVQTTKRHGSRRIRRVPGVTWRGGDQGGGRSTKGSDKGETKGLYTDPQTILGLAAGKIKIAGSPRVARRRSKI